jgi:two-component system sporulation sensor kinase A
MQSKPRRSTESNFITLLNFIADPAVIVDEKGKFLIVNDAFMDLTGLSKKELLGASFLDTKILTADSKVTLLKNLMKRMKGLPVEPYEISFTDKTGKVRYVEVKAKKIDRAGQAVDLVIFRDITRRKENARRLKEYSEKMEALVNEKVKEIEESEEKYRELINGMNDTAWVIDFDGKFVDVNDAAVKVLGYSREELVSMGPPDIDNSLTVEQIRDLVKRMPADEIQVFETAHTTKDGKKIPVEISSSLVTYKGKQAILSIARNITERKKMEYEFKQERDMLESVTENIGAGLAIISKDYRILWANKLLKQTGDIENKLCYSTFNTIDTVCPDCGVKKVFETGVSFDSHEYRCPFEKGKDRWIELIVTPIKDKNGAVIAALELSIDITEKKLMQNKLSEYSQKLEKIIEKRTKQLKQTQAKLVKSERLATIGELAAMVGHDLRNPLTGIMGAAYYLKTKHGAELGTKGKEMLESIENAISYSNKIVNDLLEYSRDLKLNLAEVTPKALLKNVLSLLAVPDKIQIVDAIEDNSVIKADTEKMCRVFVNIIKNAIDAMPEGGTLKIKSREVKGKLEITFKDTGTGMSEETLSELKRGVPLFTTKAKGMGFGLPICKRIAEAHGGNLSLESKIGKGTTVTVAILVNPKPVNEAEEFAIFSEPMSSAVTTQERPEC